VPLDEAVVGAEITALRRGGDDGPIPSARTTTAASAGASASASASASATASIQSTAPAGPASFSRGTVSRGVAASDVATLRGASAAFVVARTA
jgi:hypothetical protein